MGYCMTRFQGWDNTFHSAKPIECLNSLMVGSTVIIDSSDGFQVAVLGPNTRIIQTTRNRVDWQSLATLILQ